MFKTAWGVKEIKSQTTRKRITERTRKRQNLPGGSQEKGRKKEKRRRKTDTQKGTRKKG